MVDESKSAQSEPASGPVGAGRQTEEKGQAAGVNASAAPANPAVAGVDTPTAPADPGFLERGGLRRRLRFLRKTRELAYRDLGGLVFEMHRLGQQREGLLAGKLATMARIDTELRAIEETLHQRRGVTVLREAGVTACPRCAAIHGSEDRFCPACGFSMGSHADRPIGAPVAAPPSAQPPAPMSPAWPTSGPPRPPGAAPSPPAAPRPLGAPPTPPSAPPSPPSGSPSSPPVPARPPMAPPTSPLAPVQPAQPIQPSTQQPPHEEDQPTQVIDPPTQIVRPSTGETPAETGKA
jgi:hypothetical protein